MANLPEVRTFGSPEDVAKADALEAQMQRLVDEAQGVEVVDDESYVAANEMLDRMAGVMSIFEDIIERFRKPAYEYYQSVLETKRETLKPIQEVVGTLRDKCTSYVAEQERIAREREQRLLAEAKERVQNEAEQEFERAVATGDSEAAERALERAEYPEAFVVQQGERESGLPPVEGVSYRETWSGELLHPEDMALRKLCAAVASGDAPLDFVTVNSTAVNKAARALRDSFQYPGLRAVCKKTMVRR